MEGLAPPREQLDTLRPLQRLRLFEEVAQKVLDYIAEARLKEGDRLPTERELARRLGVSRVSVRQATVALEVQHIIEVRHGDGTYLRRAGGHASSLVPLLDRRQRLPEILEAREALECKLAELAARRRTAEDLTAMDRALDHMADEIAAGDIGSDGDRQFHGAVAGAARNRVLAELMQVLAPAVHETRLESLSEPGRPEESLEAHRRIAAAIRSQRPREAAAAMRRHLKTVADVRLLRWKP